MRERELEREILSHLDAEAEESGRRRARIVFGNAQLVKEDVRAEWGWMRLEQLARDVRLGVRQLRRSPAFTVVAVATVALGIGANTAIFSVVNNVLLRPLDYPNPSRLMYLTTSTPGPVSVPEYLEFQEFNHAFDDVGAFRIAEMNLSADDRALRVRSASVDTHLLTALGVRPAAGRLFAAEDTVPIAPALPGGSAVTQGVALVSQRLWESAFGALPPLGRTIDLDGRPVQVVGLMPRGADLMDAHVEVWLPLGFTQDERRARNNHNLFLIGRLRDGVTSASAQTELGGLLQTWSTRTGIRQGPDDGGQEGHLLTARHRLVMRPLADQVLGDASRSIWVLQAAAGLVLLLACANVANLLLGRAETRRREFAVLIALGASRGRLLRKVLTESILLVVCGCALGVPLARAAITALVRAYPSSLPRIEEVAIDARVIVVALGTAVACGLLLGLASISYTRADAIAEALKSSPRGSSGMTRHRIGRGLVSAETGLAFLVVVGAALLVRTVHNLTTADAGFDRSRLVTFSIALPRAGFKTLERATTYQRVVEQLQTVPGIDAATVVTSLPLDREFIGNATEITGAAGPISATAVPIDYQRVTLGFFHVTGVPIVEGRGFEATDGSSGRNVVVINEAMARAFWEGRSPIGQLLRPAGTQPWFSIVGVARNVKQSGVDQPVGPEAYLSIEQLATDSPTSWVAISPTTVHVLIRTALPLPTVAAATSAVMRTASPTVPVAHLREMNEVFADSIRRPRLLAQLVAVFAGIAVLLAAIGTYGILSYFVTERRREIGIRMALGSRRTWVLAEVMKQGLLPTSIGVAVGLSVALGANHLLAPLLFGVRPTDATTMSMVLVVISLVAAVACGLPAWRASRLDPNVVLREG